MEQTFKVIASAYDGQMRCKASEGCTAFERVLQRGMNHFSVNGGLVKGFKAGMFSELDFTFPLCGSSQGVNLDL